MLIGVDIGTQGTKAALFAEDGECLARAFRPSKLHRPQAGTTEEDPEDQVTSVCQTIRACLREVKGASVAGIGIDGQMAGVIGVGRDGKHVTPYDSWLDTRCTPYVKEMQRHAGARVLAKTGCPPSINHGPKKLWWMHQRKKTYRAILESVALEYCLYKRTVQRLYHDAPLVEVRITGGGEKSALWNRIKADALQIPVRRINENEGAPMGAALLAGFGVGVFADLRSAAKRWITAGRRVRPHAAAAPFYARRLARYESLLQRLDGA